MLQQENSQLNQLVRELRESYEQRLQDKAEELTEQREESHKLNLAIQDMQTM